MIRVDGKQAGYLQTALKNGLEVILQENHSVPMISAHIFVKAGGITENRWLGSGISHYCEHLISSGTTSRRTQEQYIKFIDSIGAISNAYTTLDHTSYFITAEKQHQDQVLEMLSEWVTGCIFRAKEVEREKQVIIKEINMRNDEAPRSAYNLLGEVMYKFHPAKNPNIGHLELFVKLSRDDLVAYYDQMYIPNNSVLVVAGDFDTQEIQEKIG